MKNLPILFAILLLFSCSQIKDNSEKKDSYEIADSKKIEKVEKEQDIIIDRCGKKKLTLNQLRNIKFYYYGQDSITDSLLEKNYFSFKNMFESFLDSNKRLVIDANLDDINKKFLNGNCIMSLKEYVATDSITFIYKSPIYDIYPENNKSKIIDTVKMFDYVIVPLIDNELFKVRNPREMWSDYLNICFYNGRFGFFVNNSCIGSEKIESFHEKQFALYKGNKTIIRNLDSDQYFIFPTNEVVWSDDRSKLLFKEYSKLKDSNDFLVPQIAEFDMLKWEENILVYGKSPDFFNSNNSFIYFNPNKNNTRRTTSINMYYLDSNIDKILLQIPDSLDCGIWVETYSQSVIKNTTWNNQDCYLIKLYSNFMDEPNSVEYFAYFNENGELLELK